MLANSISRFVLIAPVIWIVPGVLPLALADDKSAEVAVRHDQAEAIAKSEPVIEVQETVEILPGRPAWIASEPKLKGKTHTIPVSSGPYAPPAQAKGALDEALVKATNDYIAN